MFRKKKLNLYNVNLSGEKGQSKGMQQRQTLDHNWAKEYMQKEKPEPEMMRQIQDIKHIKTN